MVRGDLNTSGMPAAAGIGISHQRRASNITICEPSQLDEFLDSLLWKLIDVEVPDLSDFVINFSADARYR